MSRRTRCAWILIGIASWPFDSRGQDSPSNAEYALRIVGPCGMTIVGAPASSLDDGTGGAPDFHDNRPGVEFQIVLTKRNTLAGDAGTMGWIWAVGVEGPLTITDVTTDGTVVCNYSTTRDPHCAGLGPFYYNVMALTGPPFGIGGDQRPENHGAVAFVQLTTQGTPLGNAGEWVIARLRVTGRYPDQEGMIARARLYFTPRVGSGWYTFVPFVYWGGQDVTAMEGNPPLTLEDCEFELKASSVGPFVRCDANDDVRLDVSDVVTVLTELFLEKRPFGCPAAADCNGDGDRDISDAIYLLSFLFTGGSSPPAPFPGCGRVDVPLEECPPGSTACR